VRDRCLQGVEAVIEREEGVFAKGDDDRLILDAEHGRMSISRPRRQIFDRRALLPLGNRLLVDAVALGEGPQALLTMLYRSTDCLCRAGAPV